MSRINTEITDVMVKGMLVDLKEAVEEEVMARLIEEFKAKASPMVKEAIAGLTLTRVEKFKDVRLMRDALYVEVAVDKQTVARREFP